MLYNGKNNKQTINKQQVKRIGRKNSMEIRILELMKEQRKQRLTVIIDVFRAFSLECYLYARGASAVVPGRKRGGGQAYETGTSGISSHWRAPGPQV